MMSMKAHKEEIERLNKELEGINSRVNDVDNQLELSNERREKVLQMRRETESNEQRIASIKEYLAEASEALKDYPGEMGMIQLKEKLEALRLELEQSEASQFTQSTGLQAYAQRRQRNLDAMISLNTNLITALDEIAADVAPRMAEEDSVKSVESILRNCDTMLTIDTERENHLQEVLKVLEALKEDETSKMEEYAALKQAGEDKLPEIDKECNRCLGEIAARWNKERDDLTAIYLRLLTLNKEQHHHLTRGTHIKAAVAPHTEVALQTANNQFDKLCGESRVRKSMLGSVKADLEVVKITSDKARAKGREMQEGYDELISEKKLQLEAVQKELDEAKSEGDELRSLKTRLMQKLQNYRGNSSTTMIATISQQPRITGRL